MSWKTWTATFVVAAGSMGITRVNAADVPVPHFQLDTAWPKLLPNHWQLAPVTGVFVDTHDRIWIKFPVRTEQV